ncbi:MAG: putative signaling protein [Phycisphaerales bacterium]|nr:putative signaling protein [Phycisphaerales bacterium]
MAATTCALSAREIIARRGVVTYFQPILSARQKAVTGLEALSRGIIGVEALSRGAIPQSDQLIPPDQLFGMANEEGIGDELERLCRETAIRTFARLENRNEDLILFLNFDGSADDQRPGAGSLLEACRRWGLPPNRVAVEILESKFADTQRLGDLLKRFRDCGFLLVLDDVGTGHSNLDRIPLIKPDILKVDRSLIRDLDQDYHKQETLKSLVHLARKIGALVVAEGIETRAEALVSLELGADLLQGFFLGRPERPGIAHVEAAGGRVAQLARDFKSYMVGKINQRKLEHRRFTIVLNEILCELSQCHVEQFDVVLAGLISKFPRVECIYVLDEAGLQVTDTVCNPDVPRRPNGVMFRPALRGADHSLKEYYYILLDVELHKYTTDPYVSLASGNVCRTLSTGFRDVGNSKLYVLCIDVLCDA